jgi:hypothetical protein
MFVKLWHQAQAVFPEDPSRFIAVFVIFQSLINGNPRHTNVNAGFRLLAFRIEPQNRRMLENGRIEENDVDAVMQFLAMTQVPI